MKMRRGPTVVLPLALLLAACGEPTSPAFDTEESAAGWRTWVLSSASAVRPSAPPTAGSPQAVAEIEEVLSAQRGRSAETDVAIARWSGLPTSIWHALALDRLEIYWVLLPDVLVATPVRTARGMALVNVAMYDALVAAWDAKYAYRRTAPAETDARVQALIRTGGVPSYPSEHAAVAGAAAAVLSYLLPTEDTASFHAMAREAGEARIAGGAAYRSDVEAGWEIGRAVGAQVVARAKHDGSDDVWTGTIPSGPTMWRPTPNKFVRTPFDPTAGGWRTWVISSGAAFRLGSPPATASPDFQRDMAELRSLSTGRTTEQAAIARYWATDAPSAKWERFMRDEIERRQLPTMQAARALALASVAMFDAFVACWDSKYHYWLYRPISADTTFRTVFPTPPFPSYPSGHSTISTAAAEVFVELFPDRAEMYRAKALEASLSRVYAAVHYRFDVDSGDVLGARIGQAVVSHMRRDGATK